MADQGKATVWFYQLRRLKLEDALPRMLEMSLQRDKRSLVITGSEERTEMLAGHLWTYRDDSFLPHGTSKDGPPDLQPVFLTHEDERPNQADYLFLTDRAMVEGLDAFERCHLLFDGMDDEALKEARELWKAFKTAGHELAYWEETEAGSWEKRAG